MARERICLSAKKAIISGISLAVTFAALSGCMGAGGPAPAKQNNEALQDILRFSSPSVSGSQHRLGDFRGQIVMLHFFSSWCGQCGVEAPSIRNLQSSFKDSKFTVVGVAIDDDPFQTQVFVSKYSLNFPVLLDVTGDYKTFFGITELPATLFLDRQGTPIRFQDPESGQITAKIEGPRSWDSAQPVEMVAGLVEHL